MSAPDFSSAHGIHRTEWREPESVVVEFDRLRDDRGDLTAEVRVLSTTPGLSGLLHHARHNLLSTQSTNTLARHLTARTPGRDLDWAGMLLGATQRTVEAHRGGDPAIMLRDAERPPDAGWLLPPLVLGRKASILFGDGGTGKSYLALAAAVAIHSDRSDLIGLAPTVARTVGYLDWEWDAWEHRERLERLVGASMPDLHYLPMRGVPLADSVERVRRFARDRDIGLLVIDSIGYACDGPPEEAATALRFFQALDRVGLAALCTAHVNREGSTDKPFGSAYWHNGARTTWYVAKQQEVSDAVFTVGLWNRKSNSGPLHAPLAFELDFAGDRTSIRRRDMVDVPGFAEKLPIRHRMIRELTGGALLLHEIAERLDADVEAVRLATKRGEKSKTFSRVVGPDGRERWGLYISERAAA